MDLMGPPWYGFDQLDIVALDCRDPTDESS